MKRNPLPTVIIIILLTAIKPSVTRGSDANFQTMVSEFAKIAGFVKPAVVTIMIYDYNGEVCQLGSGYFCNSHGDIITNSHVLIKNKRAQIKTWQGEHYAVESIIKRDDDRDIVQAATAVPLEGLKWLEKEPTLPDVGDPVIVAGSPMGLEQTISEGIVSAWRNVPKFGNVFQITAPISAGSSGGPVLNIEGRVVGIAAFQASQGQNLNFAIPANAFFSSASSAQKKLKFHKDAAGTIIIED